MLLKGLGLVVYDLGLSHLNTWLILGVSDYQCLWQKECVVDDVILKQAVFIYIFQVKGFICKCVLITPLRMWKDRKIVNVRARTRLNLPVMIAVPVYPVTWSVSFPSTESGYRMTFVNQFVWLWFLLSLKPLNTSSVKLLQEILTHFR